MKVLCFIVTVCDTKEIMVLIPKKTRRQILEHLFKEGVMVVKKDYQACVGFIIRVSRAQNDSNRI